jgi:hypothetical protein
VDNIKMDFEDSGWDNMDWIEVAQDSDRWSAFITVAVNLRSLGSCRVAAQLAASHEGLSCIELFGWLVP